MNREAKIQVTVPAWVLTIMAILLLPIKLITGNRLVGFHREVK